jgi:hypothetical protein
MALVGRSRVRFGRDVETGGRGRVVIVVLVVVTVAVLVMSVASSPRRKAGQAGQANLAYLDQVLQPVEQSQAAGKAVIAVRENAVSLRPDAIAREVTRIQGMCDAALAGLRRLNPPAASQVANDLLGGALAERSAGVKALAAAMASALDTGTAAQSATNALVEVGRDFDASDRAYQLFLDNVPPGASGTPGPSKWVPDESAWTPAVLLAFVAALRNGANTAPVHDLAVLLATTNPPAVDKLGLLDVLAAEKTVEVQTVIADLGNRPENHVTLMVTVTPAGAAAATDTVRDFFDLVPGQRRAVSFASLRLPPVGTPFSLSVKIGPVVGDANPVNDELVTQYTLR